MLKTIKQDNLLENTKKAGDVSTNIDRITDPCNAPDLPYTDETFKGFFFPQALLSGLRSLEAKYPGMLHSSRGMGTICAVDADSSAR